MREDFRQYEAEQNDLSLLNEKVVNKGLAVALPWTVSGGESADNETYSSFKLRHAHKTTEMHTETCICDSCTNASGDKAGDIAAPSKTCALAYCDLTQNSLVSNHKNVTHKSSSLVANADKLNLKKKVSGICNMDSNRNDREGELEIPSSQIKSRSINTETNLTAVNDAKTHTLARMLRLQRCFEENMNVLYDFCSLYVSEWPLLTLEWIPALTISDPSCDYTLKYLAVGMQASKGKPNQVQLMEVALPSVQNTDDGGYSISSAGMRPATDPGNQFQHVRGHCCFQHVITVDSPVLKIRAGSINTHLVAVKAGSGFIGVYNLAQDENMCGREHALLKIVLRGHRSGGFGLAWNPVRAGIIASGGDDCYVNYWDIRHAIDCTTVDCEARELSVLPDATGSDAWPIGRFVGHRDVVTDVSWHASEDHLLVSSSLDGDVRFWDTRFNARPTTLIEAHKGGATAAQFHPTGVFQLVTAGVRGEVSFWDTRWPKEPFMTIHYHNQCVTGLQWSPFSKTILGSFSESGQVVIWDLDKSHLPPGYSENDMAPPEVAFVHIGHLGPVTDLSWCPEERDAWIMASADALNGIHVYRPKLSILRDYIVTL